MGFFNLGLKDAVTTDYSLQTPFSLQLRKEEFIRLKTQALLQRLLRHCQARTLGLNDKQHAALYDSLECGNAAQGLNSILANAMANKTQAYIVYKGDVVRVATPDEEQAIRTDYAAKAKSQVGVLVNFCNYRATDIVKFYMGLIYNVFESAAVNLGMARSPILKMNDMRSTTSLVSAEGVIEQAASIVQGFKQGRSAIVDAADQIEVADLKGESIERMLTLIYGELATEIDMPISFVSGQLTTGMSVTGDADLNAQDVGIEIAFYSIYKPVLEALFKTTVTFKSENWRKLQAYVGLLPTVESSLYLSDEQKEEFLARIFPKSSK